MKMLSGLISAMVRQFHGTFERGGMVSSTCVDDFVLMGEIEGAHKLKGELSHEECRDSIVREPDTKGRKDARVSPMSSRTRHTCVPLGPVSSKSSTKWQTYL